MCAVYSVYSYLKKKKIQNFQINAELYFYVSHHGLKRIQIEQLFVAQKDNTIFHIIASECHEWHPRYGEEPRATSLFFNVFIWMYFYNFHTMAQLFLSLFSPVQ